MTTAVILAAGASSRMGRPKMLLPYGSSSIIETVVQAALRSAADRVCVVLGSHAEDIGAAIRHLPVSTAYNPDHRLGMFTSIQCGIRELPEGPGAVLILLGDQPFIGSRILDEVIRGRSAGGKGIVIPAYRGRRGHPLLVDLAFRDEILRMDPSEGMRPFLRAHASDIHEIDVETDEITRDIDTPEDYDESLRNLHAP